MKCIPFYSSVSGDFKQIVMLDIDISPEEFIQKLKQGLYVIYNDNMIFELSTDKKIGEIIHTQRLINFEQSNFELCPTA